MAKTVKREGLVRRKPHPGGLAHLLALRPQRRGNHDRHHWSASVTTATSTLGRCLAELSGAELHGAEVSDARRHLLMNALVTFSDSSTLPLLTPSCPYYNMTVTRLPATKSVETSSTSGESRTVGCARFKLAVSCCVAVGCRSRWRRALCPSMPPRTTCGSVGLVHPSKAPEVCFLAWGPMSRIHQASRITLGTLLDSTSFGPSLIAAECRSNPSFDLPSFPALLEAFVH